MYKSEEISNLDQYFYRKKKSQTVHVQNLKVGMGHMGNIRTNNYGVGIQCLDFKKFLRMLISVKIN